MKSKISFVCQECGYESPKYLGKCPECGEWNSLREIKIEPKALKFTGRKENVAVKKLSEVKLEEKQRILTGFSEMDGVLGGGIVKGSVILLAGDPGIGKSTLLLQVGLSLAKRNKILYISGEESEGQIKLRAKRIIKETNQTGFFLVSETNTDSIASIAQQLEPSLIIIDSIQTMESENLSGLSGSVGQVRYAASQFIKIAKSLNIPIFIVGHVTKEGMVEGPMILSHMVDTVLFLEGEKFTSTRILRSFKNRFGTIDEVGIFAMEEKGLAQVINPEQYFLGKNQDKAPGSVLVATLEGSRPFLVEIQALVVFSKLPMPRRVSSGIDYKRLELLLAVLQKHAGINLDSSDVFINVAGGLKLSDPAADLGMCLAVYSSLKNIPVWDYVG